LGIAGLHLGQYFSHLNVSFVTALGLIALSTLLQLVPLPIEWIATLSPRAPAIVAQQDLLFALGGSDTHSISIDPSRTKLGIAFLVSFSLLMLGTCAVLTSTMANRLAAAIVALGAVLAAIGIVQRGIYNGKIYGFWEPFQPGAAPFGPFVNRNHFAGWMLMVVPVALGYFLGIISQAMRGRDGGLRSMILWFASEQANRATLTGFAVLIMVLSVALTSSRSGIIGLGVTFILAGTVMVRRQTVQRRVFTRVYLILVALVVFGWVGLDQIARRFVQGDGDGVALIGRPAIWADAARIARDFWLTGTGLNTFGVATLFYQTSLPGQHLREAHSEYLQLAAEGGLLVGAPIILSILAFGREVRRRLHDDGGTSWWLRMGAVAGILAVAFQSIAEFSLQMPGNAAMFAVLAGLAIHDGRRFAPDERTANIGRRSRE
jgi:hypothetical protein